VFAEPNEALDAGHIGLEGDGLHVLKPPFFESLDFVAGQLIQGLDSTLIGEPIAEDLQRSLVI